MKKLTKSQVENILKKKGLDPKVGWFYIQFNQKFEEEYIIDNIDLRKAINNLIKFLKNKKIKEIFFFPEPSFDLNIPSGIIEIGELKKFLKENVDTITNTHIADKDLNWVFTITHEDDFFITGSKRLVKELISFFSDAECVSYKDIGAKWKN